LRTLGIPAREAVGYVPGPYDPVTDLYDIQADDAHAWVQVWFPGSGWQSFDPTAVVPEANPAPGALVLTAVFRHIRDLPFGPVGAALAVIALFVVLLTRRRARPVTWAGAVARSIERAGERAGRPRRPSETLSEYATALGAVSPDLGAKAVRLAVEVEHDVYGKAETAPALQRELLKLARQLEVDRRSLRSLARR